MGTGGKQPGGVRTPRWAWIPVLVGAAVLIVLLLQVDPFGFESAASGEGEVARGAGAGAPVVEDGGGKGRRPLAPATAPDPTLPVWPRPELEVLCRHGETGRPLAGAKVWVIDENKVPLAEYRGFQLDYCRNPLAGWARRMGRPLVADGEGRVRILKPVSRGLHVRSGLHGEFPGLIADHRKSILFRDRPLVLFFHPAGDPIVIRTVDSQGRPVGGVPVMLLKKGPLTDMPLFRGVTAPASGSLTIRYSGWYLREYWRGLFAALDFPVGPLPKLEMTRQNLGSLVLTVPANRPLDLVAVDGEGKPLNRVTHFRVRFSQAGFPGQSYEAPAGRLRLPRVGEEAPFSVLCHIQGWKQVDRRFVYGPLANHPEHRQLRLVMRRDPKDVETILLYRAVGASGQVLADKRLVCSYSGSSRPVVTDAQGWFKVRYTHAVTGRIELSPLVVEARDTLNLEQRIQAVTDQTGPFPVGTSRQGDLVLRPSPLLAAGRVVDPNGRPLSQVGVTACFRKVRGSGRWISLFSLFVRTDSEGRFWLFSPPQGKEMVIRFGKEGYTRRGGIAFQPGDRNLAVTLEPRSPNLTVSVLVDRDLPAGSVRVLTRPSWKPHGEWTALRALRTTGAKGDTRTRSYHVKQGTFDLCIRARNDNHDLHKVTRVKLGPNHAHTVPTVDLRGRIRRIGFIVVDNQGHPIPKAVVRIPKAGAPAALIFRRGEMLCGAWPEQVTVQAVNHHDQTLTHLDRENRVQLVQRAPGDRGGR